MLERERAEFFEALAVFNQQYDVNLARFLSRCVRSPTPLNLPLSARISLAARLRSLSPCLHQRKQSPPRRAPIMGGHKLDLCGLFNAVLQFQGFERVQEAKKWRELAHQLGVPRSCTSATAQLRSNYLKYLYAYECWKLHGLKLSKADLADRQRKLANKGETRALGIHEEAEGGGLAPAGSPGDPNAAARGVSSSNSSMPGKHSAPMIGGRGARGGGNAGGGGQIIGGMRPGGTGGIGGVYSVGRTEGGPAAAANQYKGSAAFGAAIPHAKGVGGGMGPNWMQHRQPTVPAGIPPSALTSYPSALPVKSVCTTGAGAGGVDGRTSIAPRAPGYWFRQKRLWSEMDDATPPVAKATYPQEATRRLFETSAARFARSVELGAEPDFSYTISALSVLSADTEVPLWDPFATQAPHQLMLALCRAVHDCGRQSKVLECCHYKRFSAQALEDSRCDWLMESSPALHKRGDHALDLLDRAMSMLRILYNFASGHAHLARALAADREAVVLLLRTALPPYTGSDLIREQALRVLKLLAGHIPDAKTTLQCFEVYLSLLGQFGGSLPPAHVSQALQGLCSLARHAEGLQDTGDKMAEMSRRHGMLAWVDDHGLLHPDPEVRLWCLRTLEAMAKHRAPPTDAAKAAAAERTRDAAAARASAADDAAGAATAAAPGKARVFEAERGAACIAPEAARLRNLTGLLVLAAVQTEHWGLRGLALRVLSGLSSLQPHEPLVEARPNTESTQSGSGEAVRSWRERLDEEEAAGRSGKYAFVAQLAEHSEAFAEVMLSNNVSDDNARAAAKLLGNIRRFRQWESALSAAKLSAVEEEVAAKRSRPGLASSSGSAAGALGIQGPEELTGAAKQPELPQSSSVKAFDGVGSKAAEADDAAKAACVGVTMGSAPAGGTARAIAIAGVETTGATGLEATVPSPALPALDSAEATLSQERWHAAASGCGDAAGTASACATASWDVAEPHAVAAGGDGATSMVSHASMLETGGGHPAMAMKAFNEADSTGSQQGARPPGQESAGVEGPAAPGGTWAEDGQCPAAELEDIGNLDAEQTDPWTDHGKDEALF